MIGGGTLAPRNYFGAMYPQYPPMHRSVGLQHGMVAEHLSSVLAQAAGIPHLPIVHAPPQQS
jgi:hypothetical protein